MFTNMAAVNDYTLKLNVTLFAYSESQHKNNPILIISTLL